MRIVKPRSVFIREGSVAADQRRLQPTVPFTWGVKSAILHRLDYWLRMMIDTRCRGLGAEYVKEECGESGDVVSRFILACRVTGAHFARWWTRRMG